MSNDEISTHFSDFTYQECMIFARIGHGPCYYHWNEIYAGVPKLPPLLQAFFLCHTFWHPQIRACLLGENEHRRRLHTNGGHKKTNR